MNFAARLVLGSAIFASFGAAWTARADDLGDAIEFISEATDRALSPTDLMGESRPDDQAAIGMLTSRDIKREKPLEDYDCWSSLVDAEKTFRWGDNERIMNRSCHELSWKRGRIPGYKTLGPIRRSARDLRPLIEEASNETDVPFVILDAMIRFLSGYRPGVIREDGARGLMQLRPEVIRELDVRRPLDERENVFAGARYLARMLDRYDGRLEPAIAAFLVGPEAVDRAGGHPPGHDRRVLFMVREVRRLYKVSIAEFPTQQGVEDIVHVITWMER